MKKLFTILILLIFIFPLFNVGKVYAVEVNNFKVITECYLYEGSKLNYEEGETGIVATLSFGEIIRVYGEKIQGDDCSFQFYDAILERNGEFISGFVISDFVIDESITSLIKMLDPNAKTLNIASIFNSLDEEDKMLIGGDEIILERFEEIKIIDGYDRAKTFHEIMFEQEGIIYTGYIKTSDLLVKGYNPTFILAMFIFIIVFSIAISILFTTRKKRKKAKKQAYFLK